LNKLKITLGGKEMVLLASCLGDEDTGGGLFSFDGALLQRIDRVSSTGLFAAENKLVRLLRSRGDTDASGEILLYDPEGVRAYFRIDGLHDPHDILWDGQQFIVVSSSTNSVLWISSAGQVVRQWQAVGDGGDARHLNCLLIKDRRLLVSAFGRFKRHRQWAEESSERTGIVFDLLSDEDVLTGLSHPHHPRFMDENWLVCNSLTRQLLAIDPCTKEVVKELELDGYTRGIAVSDDLLFVGESANRGLNPGTTKTAQIAILNKQNWSLLDRLVLPCREIYDLVMVPKSLEIGVRRGFRTNYQRVAERDQYAMFDSVGVEPLRLWATGDPLPPEACRINVQANPPAIMSPSSLIELNCSIENLGSAILVSAPPNPVHLSYKWLHGDGAGGRVEGVEGMRSKLPQSLWPGTNVTCKLKVATPRTEGSFILVLTLVQEQVAWFDDLASTNSFLCAVEVQAREQADAIQ
jgi:acetolactate synthase I/II/III large subunit